MPTASPSTPQNLTPQLSQAQLQQNIDALQKGGMATSDIQSYVNNYKSDGNGGYVLANAPAPSTTTPATPTPTKVGTQIASGVGNVADNVKTDTEGHAANIVQDLSQKPSMTGALDVLGNVAGEVGDFFGEPLKAVASAALSPQAKQTLAGAAKSIAGTPEAQGVINAWNKLQAQHPDAAKNIGNVVNIASLFGGDAASPTVDDTIQATKQGAQAVSDATAGAADAAKGAVSTAKDFAGSAVNAPITAAKDLATPIEKNVLSVLKSPLPETESTLKQLFSQAKTAVSETGAPTPFDTVGKKQLGEALQQLNAKLTGSGQKIADTLATSGKNTVNVAPIMEEFESGLPSRLGTVIDKEGNFTDAPGRISLLTNNPSDSRIVSAVHDTLKTLGDEPTLQQVNDAVDKLQGQLYKSRAVGAEPINTNTESFVKSVVGKLNQAAKTVGGEDYSAANSDYSRIKNLQFELNNRLGNGMKNAGSIMKRIFSPQDGGTKNLIKQLEQETGQPIFHDATLAKFAMDAVGDPRAKSLLQNTMETKSKGFTKAALDYITSKLEDPEGKALRIVAKAKSTTP